MMRLALPHKNAPPELKNSYYSIYALSLVILGIILMNVFGNYSLKRDHDLETRIMDQHSQIESYASSHNKLPDIIADIGVTDSQGVEYKKVSDSRYMLCATFKTKSNGFSNASPYGDPRLMEGANLNLSANTKFSDGGLGYLKHDKGHTCIYYTSDYIAVSTPPRQVGFGSVRTECSKYEETYPFRTSATIESVDTTGEKIYLNQTGQQYYNGLTTSMMTLPIKYLTYNGFTTFYATDCTKINADALKVGQTAYFFTTEADNGSLTGQVEARVGAAASTPSFPANCNTCGATTQ